MPRKTEAELTLERLAQRRAELAKELENIDKKEERAKTSLALNRNADFQRLAAQELELRQALHHTRICIARKKTSIKSNTAKIERARREMEVLAKEEQSQAAKHTEVLAAIEDIKRTAPGAA